MGARAILIKQKDPKRVAEGHELAKAKARVQAAKDERAKAVIANALVENDGRDLTPRQIGGIARGLRRSKDAIRELINEAREELAANAGFYVQSHKDVVEQALAVGDPKALEVAARASQWAMEKISLDGARIIDAPTTTPDTGSRIIIGIQLGGRNTSVASAAVLPPAAEDDVIDAPLDPTPTPQV